MLLLFTGAGQVALHVWGLGMIDDAVASGDIGRLDAYDNVDRLATATYLVLTLIVGVCWMVWQYWLARSLSPGLPQRTPPWHAWSWLIPIGNLWLPLQNVRDLWRLLVPSRSGQILGLWWIALLLTGFISRIVSGAVDTVDSVDTFKSVVGWEIVADALGIVAGIFAIWLVRTLTRAGLSQPDLNPGATPAA